MGFTRVIWNWYRLHRNQWLPRPQLEKLQLKKLKAILTHAYNNVPFYKRFYKQHGIRPDELNSPDDIRKFPMITKEMVRDSPLKVRTAIGVDMRRCLVRTTSGSTGIPTSVLEDENSVDYLDAYHLRRLFEYGYRPWKKIFVFSTEREVTESLATGEARMGLMKNLRENRIKRFVIAEDIDKHIEMMKREKPTFIVGMPSYFRVITQTVSERGFTNIRPEVLVSCGEVLDDSTRKYCISHLKAQVYDGYGCVEIAPLGMAWECRKRSGLHINMDVVHLEFLKDGEPITPGEKGEVVATSLFRFATPMIRYQVGDIATLSDETCPCGREMPLIRNIEGRIVDYLEMPDGRLISPYAVIFAIKNIPGISRYQVVQENKDRIVATIEKGRTFTYETYTQIRDACMTLFASDDIQFEIKVIQSFPIIRGRKFRLVESRIHH